MAKQAEKISRIKQTIANSQKTLLSLTEEFLSPSEVIVNTTDFSGKRPSLVVVFGSCLTAAKDAGKYIMNYRKRFGYYPKVICLPGLSLGRHINLGANVEYWLKYILYKMGIPEEVISQDVFDFEASNSQIEVLKEFIRKGRYKYVAVFSSRGYSVSTAISLKEELPSISFKFYVNQYIQQEYLCMDSEDMSGYGLDLILGEIIRLNMRRDTLPKYVEEHLMPMEMARKYVEKGYVLGIQNCDERKAVGLGEEEYKELLAARRIEFPWFGDAKKAYERTKQQVELLLKR